jgi:uncharacterized membrane protein YciS (DUF1049 family)
MTVSPFFCAHIPAADNAHYVKLKVMTCQGETKVSHLLGTVLFVVTLSVGLSVRKLSMMFCRKQVTKVENR